MKSTCTYIPIGSEKILPALVKAFPNCQFIITTHSPQVLGEVPSQNIFMLHKTSEGIQYKHPDRSYGLGSSDILKEAMNSKPFNIKLYEAVDKINTLIDDEDFKEARKLLEKCEKEYENAPILVTTRAMLEFSE